MLLLTQLQRNDLPAAETYAKASGCDWMLSEIKSASSTVKVEELFWAWKVWNGIIKYAYS